MKNRVEESIFIGWIISNLLCFAIFKELGLLFSNLFWILGLGMIVIYRRIKNIKS